MLLMWPLKKDGAPAEKRSGAKSGSRYGFGRARSFSAFLLFGFLRIFCFLLVPAAFVAEWVGWYSSAAQACPDGISPEQWCYDNVVSQVSTLRIAECEDPVTNDDYLIEFCQSCRVAGVSGRGDLIGYTADCDAMRAFSLGCLLRCQSDASKPPQMLVFQSLAACYSIFFVGSFFVFTRPGATHEFNWERGQRKNVGLGTAYVATPTLLSVPATTALMYYGVWAICLTAKILFGYYLLIQPLLLPIDFILSADYNCWTPYTGKASNPLCSERNPYCACSEDLSMQQMRGVVVKGIMLVMRLAVPCAMYFIDTYLWFSWTTGCLSTALAWWMRLGKVSSWSDLVNSFAESCALCNQMLLCKQMQPAAGPLEEEGLRLLAVTELAPASSGGAYDIDSGDLALEPRSVEWQRWARMWNTIVRSLRARDLLSNAERDELLFFSLREAKHVAFFGCPEYLVFPAMLASPLFYAKLWHRRLLGLYPHTLRAALQTRDLAVFLLVTLDVVPASQKTTMCAVVNRMWAHAARVVDLRTSDGLAKVSRPQPSPLLPCIPLSSPPPYSLQRAEA